MKHQALKRRIEETAQTIENHTAEEGPFLVNELSSSEEAALRQARNRLIQSLAVLLPPRGPVSTSDCPHCGKHITVVLST